MYCSCVCPSNPQFILLTHLLRKDCIVKTYNTIIKDRVTADSQQKEVEQSATTALLNSADDVTESSVNQKQTAAKVVSSFVQQSRRSEDVQSHTTMDERLQQLCEIFPDVPLERVKSFLVASGYDTQIAASALSNMSAPGPASPSDSPSSGSRQPRQSMDQRRSLPQPRQADHTQPTSSYDRDPVSPSSTAVQSM